MKSKIRMAEVIKTKKSKVDTYKTYYPCKITAPGGTFDALFTFNQLHVAIERAHKHSKEVPKSFWSKILSWKK